VKAVFLCAGKGTRMRPISFSVPKHLIPIANKELLRYNVEKIIDAGITEIGLVVSPEMASLYKETLGSSKWGASIDYIPQEDPKGLAHAVACAEKYVDGEDFFVYLGDNLLESDLKSMIENFQRTNVAASILLAAVDDPERFGVVELDGQHIARLVEKPDNPPTNLAIVGAYAFTSEIFSAIEKIDPSDRGELEITDAIQTLIDLDNPVTYSQISGWWLDVGRPSDAITANRILLDELSEEIAGKLHQVELTTKKKIQIEQTVEATDSKIIGPVSIADGVHIQNSTIGPYVSVGEGSEIKQSHLKESIIMSEVNLEKVNLTQSIVGSGSEILLHKQKCRLLAGNQTKLGK